MRLSDTRICDSCGKEKVNDDFRITDRLKPTPQSSGESSEYYRKRVCRECEKEDRENIDSFPTGITHDTIKRMCEELKRKVEVELGRAKRERDRK